MLSLVFIGICTCWISSNVEVRHVPTFFYLTILKHSLYMSCFQVWYPWDCSRICGHLLVLWTALHQHWKTIVLKKNIEEIWKSKLYQNSFKRYPVFLYIYLSPDGVTYFCPPAQILCNFQQILNIYMVNFICTRKCTLNPIQYCISILISLCFMGDIKEQEIFSF